MGPVPIWMIFLLSSLEIQPLWAKKSFSRSHPTPITRVRISAIQLFSNKVISLSENIPENQSSVRPLRRFNSRSTSRAMSCFLIDWRLSYWRLPFARAISTFAKPFLK